MAAKYRKIDPRVWSDERFARLGQQEKLLAVYCLTSPQANRVGLFRFSLAMAREDLGDTVSDTVFDTVCHTLNWRYDRTAKVLYFPTWWKYNHPDNPKHWKGSLSDLHDVPETPLLQEFATNLKYIDPKCHDTFRDGIGYRMGYGMAYQEQEQEQEQEQDSSVSDSVSGAVEASGNGRQPPRLAANECKVQFKSRDLFVATRIAKQSPGGGASVRTIKSLDRHDVADWFSRHIATPHPLCGPTALDLLLVLSFARSCSKSSREIQNKVALFAKGMANGKWLESAEHCGDESEWLVEQINSGRIKCIQEEAAA